MTKMDQPADPILLARAIAVANRISDGHLTIHKHTTDWAASFATPRDEEDLAELFTAPTLREALAGALAAAVHSMCGMSVINAARGD